MVTINYLRRARLVLFLACIVPIHVFAEPDKSYLGVGSCSSSNCHGAAKATNDSNVLRNEFVTWLKHDRHSESFKVLYSEEAKKMARHLDIADPTKEKLCLDCHALAPEPHLRGAKFYTEDGVSCEACHGASEGWIHLHAQEGATHEKNVAAGMRDLSNLENRVSLCADCHFGSKAVVANHRLIGSGHPRLAFELDTFESVAPRHWKVDDDYIKRKGTVNAVQGWLLTQTELATRSLQKMSRSDHPIEDFSNYYCYSCHHSLAEKQFMTRDYNGRPGELRLNLSNLLLLQAALRRDEPALAEKLRQAIADLHDPSDLSEAISDARDAVEDIKAMALKLDYPSEHIRGSIFDGLRALAASGTVMDYQMADQITMGLATTAPDGVSMRLIYAVMKDPHQFDNVKFKDAARFLVAKAHSETR